MEGPFIIVTCSSTQDNDRTLDGARRLMYCAFQIKLYYQGIE